MQPVTQIDMCSLVLPFLISPKSTAQILLFPDSPVKKKKNTNNWIFFNCAAEIIVYSISAPPFMVNLPVWNKGKQI